MKLTKLKAWLVFNGIILLIILLYQAFWIFSKTADANILAFEKGPDVMGLQSVDFVNTGYIVNEKQYFVEYPRNSIRENQQFVEIRYSILFPKVSRINNFTGNWLMPLLVFILLLAFSSMLWFVPNDILPKGSILLIQKSKPWIRLVINE